MTEQRRVTVIIPAAATTKGLPSWCRLHPKGHIILEDVLKCLDLENVSRVVLALRREHLAKFCESDAGRLEKLVSKKCFDPSRRVVPKFEVFIMEIETASAPETVVHVLHSLKISGPIFIKDSDGSFRHKVLPANYVVGLKIDTNSDVEHLAAKSFLEITGTLLTNIQEKQIISDTISVGGYGFQDACEFIQSVQALLKIKDHINLVMGGPTDRGTAPVSASSSSSPSPQTVSRLFISHVIQHMMVSSKILFAVDLTEAFDDWKTEIGWRRFVQKHQNVLVYLEGVLFQPNTTNVLDLLEEGPLKVLPIQQNIEYLRKIRAAHRSRIVILTNRPESERAAVEALLQEHGVPFDQVVFQLMACTAFMVNSYSEDGLQHPSAISYCVPAGSSQLGSVLHLV